jgi:ornithine decarboxylase
LKAIYHAALRLHESLGFAYSGYGFAGHVGTNTTSPSHYQHLLGTFRVLGQELRRRAGISIRFFDLGGGYCDGMHAARAGVTQRELLSSIHAACDKFRQEYGDEVTIIAEPGRYMVADTAVVVTRAKGVSEAYFRAVDGVETFERHKVIHLDDGLYGNLMGQVQDGRRYELIPFRLDAADAIGGEGLASAIWGPTCDSFDRIIPPDDYRVPADFSSGDFMMVECMGAYSTVTATEFNRTKPTTIVTYCKTADGGLSYTLYGTNGTTLRSGTVDGGR